MKLFLIFIKKLYISLTIFIKDINKIAVYQKYYIVKKRGNRKDKNSDLRKIYLKDSQRGFYKDKRIYIQYGTCEKKKQQTKCP